MRPGRFRALSAPFDILPAAVVHSSIEDVYVRAGVLRVCFVLDLCHHARSTYTVRNTGTPFGVDEPGPRSQNGGLYALRAPLLDLPCFQRVKSQGLATVWRTRA
jgi:hypothetical protein